MNELRIIRPDDWHLHLRDGFLMETVLPYTINQFSRAMIMPNLKPPVVSTLDALKYKNQIIKCIPQNVRFEPFMTVYLTDSSDSKDIEIGFNDGILKAAKFYPMNATTNSSNGVSDYKKIWHIFEMMEKIGMPLLIHGEVTDHTVDIFDREMIFIDRILSKLMMEFSGLRVVMEHITTKESVDFVLSYKDSDRLGATITPHHLLLNRNALFNGGLNPHHYCLPVLKREHHRQALLSAVTSENKSFFLGTDSAPHLQKYKECECSCAGIFSSCNALELYAEAFDSVGGINHLEAFSSINGPNFYKVPINDSYIILKRGVNTVMEKVECNTGDFIKPFYSGKIIKWLVEKDNECPSFKNNIKEMEK